MEKKEVVAIVLDVLEIINERHREGGRHELNRTNLAESIAAVRDALTHRASVPVPGDLKPLKYKTDADAVNAALSRLKSPTQAQMEAQIAELKELTG